MRRHFDLDPSLIYLNSGTHSILPRVVQDAVTRHQKEFERNPTLNLFQGWERLWNVQKELAGFFHADPRDFFLRPNITAALNAFILGIPLPAKSEILVTDLEYGAIVNLCRFRAERDGLTLRQLHLPAEPGTSAKFTPEDWRDLIVRDLRPETRLLLISHVATAHGLVLPLAEIARETRKRGILLVVDGAHGPGAMPLDFRELPDVDFYGGNLHKWMMGPKGTSFGWVPGRHHESLKAISAGWTTYEIPAPFAAFGEGDLFQARMLMSACHDFAPFLAIHEMLEFWKAQNPQKILSRIAELQAHAEMEAARILGWPRISPPAGKLRGPLLSFELPDKTQAKGFDFMRSLILDHGVQVGMTPIQGRFCLRLSPHVYNTEKEITQGLLAVTKAAT